MNPAVTVREPRRIAGVRAERLRCEGAAPGGLLRDALLRAVLPAGLGVRGRAGEARGRVAAKHGATPSQVALAWLLHRDEHILLIPGTSSIGHLEENLAAAGLRLDADEATSPGARPASACLSVPHGLSAAPVPPAPHVADSSGGRRRGQAPHFLTLVRARSRRGDEPLRTHQSSDPSFGVHLNRPRRAERR